MDQLKENIGVQLNEIEILKSIYSNTNEFQIEDEEALMDATEFLETEKSILSRNISFLIRITIQSDQAEVFSNAICKQQK